MTVLVCISHNLTVDTTNGCAPGCGPSAYCCSENGTNPMCLSFNEQETFQRCGKYSCTPNINKLTINGTKRLIASPYSFTLPMFLLPKDPCNEPATRCNKSIKKVQ